MHLFLIWLAFASVQLAATMSPGPAFALTVRNAIAHHRAAGIFTAIGLGLGVAVHCVVAMAGFSFIVTKYPVVYDVIRFGGAGYLIYLGVKGLKAKKRPKEDIEITPPQNPGKALYKFILSGMATNVLNPKAWVFFPAVFIQFITPETPVIMLVTFGLTSTVIEMGWFSCLTIFLTNPRIRVRFLSISHWIERVCGVLLIGLGIKLVLEKGIDAL